MANKFLESFNKANKKLSAKDFKSKKDYYPAKKNLLLDEITKVNKVLKKDGDNKDAFYAKDNLLGRLDSVEQAIGLKESKTPLSQGRKASGGKVYAMNRNMGGPVRKPRMK